MHALEIILVAKIALTIILWAIPTLFFSTPMLKALGFEVPHPRVFLTLYGMACVSLTVGYVLGLRSLQLHGTYPTDTIAVGIVSNGGSCAILIVAALRSVWKEWGIFARVFMWFSLVATGSITLGLVMFGPLR